MLSTPLVQTFRTLTKTERRAFGKWIASPFFNQRPDVVRLFEYLCKQVPYEQAGKLVTEVSKVAAFRQVFPPDDRRFVRAFSDADMRHTMSFLFQALKHFLAYQHWSQDAGDTGRHLCKSLRQRGLEQVFEKEFAALSEHLSSTAHRSADYFFQQYHLHLERWEVFRRSNRGASDVLQQAGSARDAYIASETLRQACAVLAQPGERGTAVGSVYLEATLVAVAAGAFESVPAVMAYYHCYRLLVEQDAETDFRRLRTLLVEHWSLFPDNEIRDLYVGAINYCIRRLNSGARDYIREALELYRTGLERRIILEDGFLNKYTYNNILLLALALEEWDWGIEFLKQYKPALPPRDRDSAWQYNLATYYFRKKDYAQAQEILNKVEFRDVFYNLDARRMLVRIYFDTDATAALESLLDSFTIYLQRKRTALGYHRDLNLNFVRFVKRLLQVEPGNSAARQRLRIKIEEVRYVAEREWLLGKC
jgi:hypothetical protein